jgi:threonine dehydratase
LAQLDDEEKRRGVIVMSAGNLAQGVAYAARRAAAIKLSHPEVRVVGVELASGRLVQASVAAGQPLGLARGPSLADGLASPTTSGLVVELVGRWVDDLVAVSEDEIRQAMRGLLQRGKLLVEGAGAVGVAALLAGRIRRLSGQPVVAVLSGGNRDVGRLPEVLRGDDRP